MGTLDRYPHELNLPRKFMEDRSERGLPCGYNPIWRNARQVWIRCNEETLIDIESDASFYSTDVDKEYCPPGLIESARRTVATIKKYRHKRDDWKTRLKPALDVLKPMKD